MFPDRPDLLEAGHVLREWEEETYGLRPSAHTWTGLLEQWDRIETDFQRFYGIDLAEVGFRTWRWFQTRTLRLLGEDTALGRWARVKPADRAPDQGNV